MLRSWFSFFATLSPGFSELILFFVRDSFIRFRVFWGFWVRFVFFHIHQGGSHLFSYSIPGTLIDSGYFGILVLVVNRTTGLLVVVPRLE